MRKIVLSLAAAGASLAAASPAAAQYYPRPPVAAPGYGYGYNAYNGGWGEVRSLQMRIDNIERQIDGLDRRDRLGDRTADRLRDEARGIEHRLRERARGGLDPREAGDVQYRIQRLEQRVQFAMADHHPRWGDRDDRWDRHDRD